VPLRARWISGALLVLTVAPWASARARSAAGSVNEMGMVPTKMVMHGGTTTWGETSLREVGLSPHMSAWICEGDDWRRVWPLADTAGAARAAPSPPGPHDDPFDRLFVMLLTVGPLWGVRRAGVECGVPGGGLGRAGQWRQQWARRRPLGAQVGAAVWPREQRRWRGSR
jgi:hypothetical protein